jgi:hypothetical protein
MAANIASTNNVTSTVTGTAIGAGVGYQGIGYSLVDCKDDDTQQFWNGSNVNPADAEHSHDSRGEAVNLHVTHNNNGTLEEVRASHGCSSTVQYGVV